MSAALPAVPPPLVVRLGTRFARFLRWLSYRMAPPQLGLTDLVWGHWVSDALYAITRVGLPEAMADGPRTAASMAESLGLHVGATRRVLRALAREGLLAETRDDRFGLTGLTRPLLADHPASMRNMVLNQRAPHNAATWTALEHGLRTGTPSWDALHGAEMWAWYRQHPDEARRFHGTMAEYTRDIAAPVAKAWPWSRAQRIVDLGGRTGTLLGTLLTVAPQARGVLVDQAEVVADAGPVLEELGVADRVEVRAGDVFEDIPEGGGAYVAKHILHSYDDDHCARVLSRWKARMAPDATLLLVELVVPGPGEGFLASLDLQMLVSTPGGRERTEREWRAVLAAGGFTLTAVHPTASPFCVIEARPG